MEAPPPYEDNKSGMYPNPNANSGASGGGAPPYPPQGTYQPSMTNPYPPNPQFPQQQQQQQFQHPQPHHHQHPHPSTNPTYVYMNDGDQYGPSPMHLNCPHCHQQVISKVRYSAGLLAWILFGACLLFGCWMGCCLIPFCMDSCQDCEHYCPNCKAFLGHYKRL